MGPHVRAALGPAGRVALVELVNQGSTFRQAAACVNVAPATAHPVVVALARRLAGRSAIWPVGFGSHVASASLAASHRGRR